MFCSRWQAQCTLHMQDTYRWLHSQLKCSRYREDRKKSGFSYFWQGHHSWVLLISSLLSPSTKQPTIWFIVCHGSSDLSFFFPPVSIAALPRNLTAGYWTDAKFTCSLTLHKLKILLCSLAVKLPSVTLWNKEQVLLGRISQSPQSTVESLTRNTSCRYDPQTPKLGSAS